MKSQLEKAQEALDKYIEKYIGDFNKPFDYKQKVIELQMEVDRLS